MDIGHAANALRLGKRVARDDWPNGEWLVLVPGSEITISADRPLGIAAPELVGDLLGYEPHIDRVHLEGATVRPWHPLPEDVLALDWAIV